MTPALTTPPAATARAAAGLPTAQGHTHTHPGHWFRLATGRALQVGADRQDPALEGVGIADFSGVPLGAGRLVGCRGACRRQRLRILGSAGARGLLRSRAGVGGTVGGSPSGGGRGGAVVTAFRRQGGVERSLRRGGLRCRGLGCGLGGFGLEAGDVRVIGVTHAVIVEDGGRSSCW